MELRWLKKRIAINPDELEDQQVIRLGIVLQYRTRTNPLEEGLHPPIWSEWKGVPEEMEDHINEKSLA